MSDVLRLTSSQMDAITAHARACKPEEACGILAGDLRQDGIRVVEQVFLMENSQHSNTFYLMDSQEQFQVFDEMQKRGLEPVAIFHSHPHSPAYPSGVDLDLAFYPDSLYLIVSLAGDEPEGRVFRIVEQKIEDAELEIIDE